MARLNEALAYDSRYCYDNGVLINKLDIKDQDELDKVEASLTYLRIKTLSEIENKFRFDSEYYLKLHGYIFQDIYPFAGQTRTENISKVVPFCRPEFIIQYLKSLLNEMKSKARSIKTMDEYINFLSYYYAEINLVHPFREGNGRTEREFFRQFVECMNDYLPFEPLELDYSKIDEHEKELLHKGSFVSAYNGDLTLLKEFFNTVLQEKKVKSI